MDQKMKNIKLELLNELHKENLESSKKMVLFDRDVKELKNQMDDMKSKINLPKTTTTLATTTMALTTLAPNFSNEKFNEIENKISKMNESMNIIILQDEQKSNQLSKIKESVSNITTNFNKLTEAVQNLENLESSTDQFINRTLEEKYDYLETMFESTPFSKNLNHKINIGIYNT